MIAHLRKCAITSQLVLQYLVTSGPLRKDHSTVDQLCNHSSCAPNRSRRNIRTSTGCPPTKILQLWDEANEFLHAF